MPVNHKKEARKTDSPDMAPSDFYLFPKLISHIRGTQYVSNEGVIEAENEHWETRKMPSILKR